MTNNYTPKELAEIEAVKKADEEFKKKQIEKTKAFAAEGEAQEEAFKARGYTSNNTVIQLKNDIKNDLEKLNRGKVENPNTPRGLAASVASTTPSDAEIVINEVYNTRNNSFGGKIHKKAIEKSNKEATK